MSRSLVDVTTLRSLPLPCPGSDPGEVVEASLLQWVDSSPQRLRAFGGSVDHKGGDGNAKMEGKDAARNSHLKRDPVLYERVPKPPEIHPKSAAPLQGRLGQKHVAPEHKHDDL